MLIALSLNHASSTWRGPIQAGRAPTTWATDARNATGAGLARARRSCVTATRSAARQLEAGNSGVPRPCVCRGSRHRVVLVDVPEGAVVDGVDRHVRVVAPT